MDGRIRALTGALLISATTAVAAQAGGPDPRIRSGDAALVTALEEGAARSEVFRSLVTALDKTDVVVYLGFDRVLPAGLGGHVGFVAAGGGRRYVRIGILRRLDAEQQIAILGHELQHVLEIARAPDVVDSAGVARLYHRIGFRSGGYGDQRYDSVAAIDIGYAIARELRTTRPRPGAH